MTLDEADRALASGNPIQAYSIARDARGKGSDEPRFRYLEALALARMGDTLEAFNLYETYDLGSDFSVDALSLMARLLKDKALAEQDDSRPALQKAAQAYIQAYKITGDYFPLINAATLAGAAGERDLSRSLAETLLLDPQLASDISYWPLITKAEALLVLGRGADAFQAATRAVAQPDASLGARSSTIRQFERLLPLVIGNDGPDAILEILRPPPVIHFCGHIFAHDGKAERAIKPLVELFLEQRDIVIGYGALAAGADILIAELLLERGAELNVVLPFPADEFSRVSVAPSGDDWVARFESCLGEAASVTIVSDMAYVDDPRQLGYGTEVAMGMAVLRASHLAGQALQLAVWDGIETDCLAGTAVDVRTWSATGRSSEIIAYPEKRKVGQFQGESRSAAKVVERGAHSILFADFSGFSKISESQLLMFWNEVMGTIAKVVRRFSDSVLCKNTWGDALYLIVDGAAVAADLALSLQEEMRQLDLVALGPESSGMRVALHYGTMYRVNDPVTGQTNFFGSEVSRAARLEPVTPKHSVYVTEPFASVLTLKHAGEFAVHYVGTIALAKNYGSQPVYRLDRKKRN
jgi:class 3 adenylate cyclase/tetratricopeptide (TPR) repeat protein